MLNTVLFDMGGTLENIWYNDDTKRLVTKRLMERLRENGLEPDCSPEEFWAKVAAGQRVYKQWSEGNMLEKKPEEIWPDYYLREFPFDRAKVVSIAEELGGADLLAFIRAKGRGRGR